MLRVGDEGVGSAMIEGALELAADGACEWECEWPCSMNLVFESCSNYDDVSDTHHGIRIVRQYSTPILTSPRSQSALGLIFLDDHQ